MRQGAYTNSTQVLVGVYVRCRPEYSRLYPSQNRVRIPHSQQSGILSISASYEGDGIDVGYTMTLYSQKSVELSWVENQKPPSYKEKVSIGAFLLLTLSFDPKKKGNWLFHIEDCRGQLYIP